MPSIKKILVPTDFSENASVVFDFVKETAQRYGSTVDLIHIIPRLSYLTVSRDALGNPFEDKDRYRELRASLEKRLLEDMENHIPEENRGRVFLKYEKWPSNAIVEHAESNEYDLIMIASRGRGGSIFTRGSVTEKLIRLTHTPVLSVNEGYNPAIENIVVPTDGSNVSMETIPLAFMIAVQNNASVELLSISKFDGAKIKIAGRSSYHYTDAEIREFVWDALSDFVDDRENEFEFVKEASMDDDKFQLKDAEGNVVNFSIVVEKGTSTHAAIVDYAYDHSQLVVMATHGRGEMAKIFIGSTTEKVVRHLKMPVLTIKPKSLEN